MNLHESPQLYLELIQTTAIDRGIPEVVKGIEGAATQDLKYMKGHPQESKHGRFRKTAYETPTHADATESTRNRCVLASPSKAKSLSQPKRSRPAVYRESSMSNSAFDTLGAARKLKAAGMEAEQADAIVEVMRQSAGQFVTVERFDAAIAMLQARIDAIQTELKLRIDTLRTDMRGEIARSHLISVGVIIAANALMITILGILLTGGTGM